MKTIIAALLLITKLAFAETPPVNIFTEKPGLLFTVPDGPRTLGFTAGGDLLLSINAEGRIKFNHEKFKHYKPGDFAREFIKIVEDAVVPMKQCNECNCEKEKHEN